MSAPGAEVIRLRSIERSPVSGHALLIGAPLGRLRGVEACLAAMQQWLEELGFEVNMRSASMKATIEQQFDALLRDVQPGDFVLVYYAGHGVQVLPQVDLHPWPLVVQLPMDAFEVEEVITGEQWQRWLLAMSQRAAAANPAAPGVVAILECCHAQGMLAQWPEGEARARLLGSIRPGLQSLAERYRDAHDLPHVVRVYASGRDENARVGALTHRLLGLLRKHGKEPWWALMDRLRATWDLPQQSPGVAGPTERVPLSTERLRRPSRLLPAVWRHDGWWIEAARATEWTPTQRLALTPTLGLPSQAWAYRREDGSTLRLVEPCAGWATADGFAWARPAPHLQQAIVGLGGVEPARREVQRRLSGLVGRVVDGPDPSGAHVVVHFEARGDDTVELLDREGEVVARTSIGPGVEEAWAAWIERLHTLDSWLAMTSRSYWRPRGFAMRWGTWVGAKAVEWPAASRVIEAGAPLWLRVEARAAERAFVTVLRVRADRAVEDLTAHAPGGLPIGGSHPRTGLGSAAQPLRLEWPVGLPAGERIERWVVLVSQRPVPLSSLVLDPVMEALPSRHWRSEGELMMVAQSYRLAAPP